jgi:hypothetical protein
MKTTDPKDYIELLEVFSIAVVNGIVDKQYIIKWADKIIYQDDEPHDLIIELSLCGHKNVSDIASIIGEFIGEQKPVVSGRVILGLLYHQFVSGQITLAKVVSDFWLVLDDDQLTSQERSLLYGLDEDFDLANENLAFTIEDVKKWTLEVLEIYKDFNLDNFKDWKDIDKTVDQKVQELSVKKEVEDGVYVQKRYRTFGLKKPWWKIW